MIDIGYTHLVFATGLVAGITLNCLLLRTVFAPPFRIWPTPEPGSWQSLTFWGLFRGGMVLTFVVAILDWNSAGLVDLSRLVIGLPLFLVGFGITVFAYFNLGLGNTYCGADGLVSHGLYRFSRNPQYASSILGLIGTVIVADSWLTLPLAFLMSCVYVLMALTEEVWLNDHYGATYKEYRERTARFFDAQGFLLALLDKEAALATRQLTAAATTRLLFQWSSLAGSGARAPRTERSSAGDRSPLPIPPGLERKYPHS